MATEATTFSDHLRGQETGYKTFAKPNYQQQFRHLIEHSDWDEEILAQEEWLNKLSISIIILAALYFIPRVVLMLFQIC